METAITSLLRLCGRSRNTGYSCLLELVCTNVAFHNFVNRSLALFGPCALRDYVAPCTAPRRFMLSGISSSLLWNLLCPIYAGVYHHPGELLRTIDRGRR